MGETGSIRGHVRGLLIPSDGRDGRSLDARRLDEVCHLTLRRLRLLQRLCLGCLESVGLRLLDQ